MDELSGNMKSRKELLKHMILQLHEGVAPREVRKRLVELLKSIPYNEIGAFPVQISAVLIDKICSL